MAFSLDSRLAQDTLFIKDLPLSALLLMNDAAYPWLILVPRRAHCSEIIDLIEADRMRLMAEIGMVSTVLKAETGAEKLNVAALGNHVRQLHVHIIARFSDDPAWPEPVWGKGSASPYAEGAARALIQRLTAHLALGT